MFNHYFSIIIATFNCADELKKTLSSINCQTFKDYEVIVIDGGSTDNFKEVIEEYKGIISYYVSEPDKGISDAFNKGVLASKGKYINFQGAGDTLYDSSVLERVYNETKGSENELLIGKINRLSEDEKKVLWVAPHNFKPWKMLFKMAMPHQGLFTHRNFFEKYGLFDVNDKFAMDYELLLRAYKTFPSYQILDFIVSNWKAGGIGKDRTLEIYKEYDRIKRLHNVAPSMFLTYIHYWSLFKYYVKKALCMN